MGPVEVLVPALHRHSLPDPGPNPESAIGRDIRPVFVEQGVPRSISFAREALYGEM
jgi:hypothetical protein